MLCAQGRRGNTPSMSKMGWMCQGAERWRWWCLGTRSNCVMTSFMDEFVKEVQECRDRTSVFLIGQALAGKINEEKSEIFGELSLDVPWAKKAVAFYKAQLKGYRDAVLAWTQVGMRLRVVKDIRRLIGKLVWDASEEAEFPF
jgi:hypothetical protein